MPACNVSAKISKRIKVSGIEFEDHSLAACKSSFGKVSDEIQMSQPGRIPNGVKKVAIPFGTHLLDTEVLSEDLVV